MGHGDALRRAFLGARTGRTGPAEQRRAGAGAELVERGARPEVGAKFRAFSVDLDGAICELAGVLAIGDRESVAAAGRRAMPAVELMEEFLDLAGGALVDLLSVDRERQVAFGAVASYGEGVAAAKEAASAALAGDRRVAQERVALAARRLGQLGAAPWSLASGGRGLGGGWG